MKNTYSKFNFCITYIIISICTVLAVFNNTQAQNYSSSYKNLSNALKIKTISDPDYFIQDEFDRFNGFLRNTYTDIFSKLEIITINNSILLKWSGSNKSKTGVVFMAHYDVVPVDKLDASKWKHPPFSGLIIDNKIYGRGALDNKGNLIALLEALRNIMRSNFIPNKDIYIALGEDEEIFGINGNVSFVKDYFLKNNLKVDFVLDEGVPMIKSELIPGVDFPIASICIAEKGYASFELNASGTSGHSSVGSVDNPIVKLSEFIITLNNQSPVSVWPDVLTDFFVTLAPNLESFWYRQLFNNLWLTRTLLEYKLKNNPMTASMVTTTTTVTKLNGGIKDNVVPTNASAVVNFRIIPGDSISNIKLRLDKLAKPYGIKVKLKQSNAYDPIKPASMNNHYYKSIKKAYKNSYNDAIVVPNIMIAGSDSHHYNVLTKNIYRATPFILPIEDISVIHGINEHINTIDLDKAIRFYESIIISVASDVP